MKTEIKNKILIIGGAGFIGTNSAEKFINDGLEVTIFDDMSRPGSSLNLAWLEKTYPKKFRAVKADIVIDQKILAEEVCRHDVVFHLAAQVAVTTSVTDPVRDFNINAIGTFNVLEAVRQSEKKPILIYASTNKVYGDLTDLAVTEGEKRYNLVGFPGGVPESQPLDFHSPYGCSKGAADQYVRDYSRIYGLRTVVLRQSCIYGRHQFGVEDQGWVAWFVIASLLGKPITLYGNGKQVRDVLFADDLVRLYGDIIEKIDVASGQIYNVGGGPENSISLLELFDNLKELGIDVIYNTADTRPGDQKIFISDNGKLENDIGWRPSISLFEGIEEIVKWSKNNMDIIRSLY